MSYGYTKLFRQILDSTVWQEDMETKVVWVTMLAEIDRFGRVLMSIPGLAKRAGVTLTGCEKALGCFLAPDPYSRTKDHEGRRIEEIDGGWRLLNHGKYRALRDEEAQRERHARNQTAYRRRKGDRKSDRVTGDVTESDPIASATASATASPTPPATATTPKTKTGGARAPRVRRAPFTPPLAETVQAYLDELGERRFTGQDFVDAYQRQGWKLANKCPMVDWKAAVRTWRHSRDEKQKASSSPGSPQQPQSRDVRKDDGHLYRQRLGPNGEVLSERRRDEVPRLEVTP